MTAAEKAQAARKTYASWGFKYVESEQFWIPRWTPGKDELSSYVDGLIDGEHTR